MYISESRRKDLIEQGFMKPDEPCLFRCGELPRILWYENGQGLYLCPAHAQYLATQLLKDVGRYEVAEGISVKVRTQIAPRPVQGETIVSIEDIAKDGRN